MAFAGGKQETLIRILAVGFGACPARSGRSRLAFGELTGLTLDGIGAVNPTCSAPIADMLRAGEIDNTMGFGAS